MLSNVFVSRAISWTDHQPLFNRPLQGDKYFLIYASNNIVYYVGSTWSHLGYSGFFNPFFQ